MRLIKEIRENNITTKARKLLMQIHHNTPPKESQLDYAPHQKYHSTHNKAKGKDE